MRKEAAEAPLILDARRLLGDLCLDGHLTSARQLIAAISGVTGDSSGMIYLDAPRWFADAEPVPELCTLAHAVRQQRQVAFSYRRDTGEPRASRTAGPLGLVNKAGIWYLVAVTAEHGLSVFRISRITGVQLLAGEVTRPVGFDLATFWDAWSAEFTASRPRLDVCLKAAPEALAGFREVFGDGARAALAAAAPPAADGWRTVTLSFEHEHAAVHRLAGFGGQIEVLSPASVRDRLVSVAEQTLDRYRGRPA